MKGAAKVNFSVPSGNFGNIFSGYLAKQMGLPIDKLIIATNENNILEQFVKTGVYQSGEFKSTHSPSMDIQVASNFERYLYYLLDQDTVMVSRYMNEFQTTGRIELDQALLQKVQEDFASYGIENEACLKTVKSYQEEYGYLLDPHTACGVAAYESYSSRGEQDGTVTVAFATAHPAKFDEAIRLVDFKQEIPAEIQSLLTKDQHQVVIDNTKEQVVDQLEKFYKLD